MTTANATYLDRPVFGGVTAGDKAYTTDVAGAVTYAPDAVGQQGVVRTVADGATVRVDVEGPDAFGPDGDSVFDHLAELVGRAARRRRRPASRPRSTPSTSTASGSSTSRPTSARAPTASSRRAPPPIDAELRLTSSLSEIENTDIVKATVDLQLQEVAYQAALAATARVMQPSLLDFLR